MSLRGSEAELLRKRSLEFLIEAEHALRRGSYDVACFLAEQSLQLYLRHVLLKVVGDYPRTHSIRHLLGEVARVAGSREVEDFMRRNRARLLALEDAYLMARYFTREYGREDAEDSVRSSRRYLSYSVKYWVRRHELHRHPTSQGRDLKELEVMGGEDR